MTHAAVDRKLHQRVKSLRQTMTRAETLLWRYLKAHHIDGLGFRRQVPMRGYVADFACHAARLIVELDGETHDFASRQRHDAARDAWFKSQGYLVLRFTNDDVLRNLEGVVEVIRQTASDRMRSTPPSLSLPHKGGGNLRTMTALAAATLVALLVPTAAALAQAVKLDVAIVIGGNSEYDACGGVGAIAELKPPDDYLAVRSGPGARYREIDRLRSDDRVYICIDKGPWVGIVYLATENNKCNVGGPWPKKRAYNGPCKRGWIHTKFLKMLAG